MKKSIIFLVSAILILASCEYSVPEILGEAAGGGPYQSPKIQMDERLLSSAMPIRDNTAYSAAITMEKKNPSGAVEEIVYAIDQMKGEIFNLNTDNISLVIEGSVPLEKKDEWLNYLSSIGTIKLLSQSGDNQSSEKNELMGRRETLDKIIAKYSKYLEEAENLDDIIKIEDKINNYQREQDYNNSRTSELERKENNFNFRLTIMAPDNFFSRIFPGGFLNRIGQNISGLFFCCLIASLYLIIGIIILVPFIAFFYWSLWGKLGLLRKIFKKLK